ncbi:helix-turn-helix transcriptional regulator [Flaviflexus huanghaiensis]|uniref:helix-turn-helix transcriptional regulator n=1 Tax=Flaviflexus huanghaiensis TaxID=1111473 RepID=UPI0015F9D691|nr:helix-turn-helix transcriptional regulator [Flaviflexus huanghaiensis]
MDLYAELGIDPTEPGMRSAIDMERQRRSLMRKLIEIRNSRGLNTSDVAKELQISPQAAARIEAGNRDARLSTITRYAIAVGAHVSIEIEPVEDVYERPEHAVRDVHRPGLKVRLEKMADRAIYEPQLASARTPAAGTSFRMSVNG